MAASVAETGLSVEEATSDARALSGGARFGLLVAAIAVLTLTAFCSLFVGSRGLDPAVVMAALLHPDGSPEHVVIQNLRLPRTVLGVLVGAALGVGGALIQAFTRNPLADPGILGVNAGAGFAIVLGSAVFGITSVALYLPFAFVGAIATTLVVYGIARRGGGGATPLRLTLVGIALAAVLNGISSTLTLLDPDTFDRLRYWGAGTIADRPDGTIQAVTPFIVAGLVMSLLLARSLNVFALGDELAQSLGARVTRCGS